MNKSKTAALPQRACPQCGAQLAPGTSPELCPKCMLKQALTADSTAAAPDIMPSVRIRSGGLPAAGQQFGHYRIVRPLGGGGMGVVFEAEDLESSRRIALKVLGHSLDSPEARERFFREGRLAASVNHPNSVYVFGTEVIADTPVIAMELIPGGTLEQRVRTRGPMPVAEAVDAILQIIAGLQQAQRLGILHRDVKPSNCFVDVDGTVKIGDFGLSICTSLRTEPALTATGAFLGTPGFCPPEQLRGEELDARSDMYSVGATLFYLLTGHTPFQAKNVVALIATVLEQPVPSPRQFKCDLPLGLERAIRRCLEKQSPERFKDYGELAAALAPFSSAAPVPASLGLRFLAGVIDVVVLGGLSLLVLVATGLDPMDLLNATSQPSWQWLAIVLLGLTLSVLYYTGIEGRWGAAVGKALCNLRIIGPQKSAPGWGRAFVRALIYVVLPLIPVWLIVGFDPKLYLGKSGIVQFMPSFLFYGSLAALFLTARKHNGYAALHDLASRSRVITRICFQPRPALGSIEAPIEGIESHPQIGPYNVIQPFEGSTAPSSQMAGLDTTGPRWFVGYDLRLLRKVWIRTLQPGTPPISPQLRNLGRAGRLRWLTGRRTPQENWDAFEGVSGQPLLSLVAKRQVLGWQQVRFWLLDLAQELAAAEKDQTLPATLALDRIWITGEGRLKLLDFVAPGLTAAAPEPPAVLTERAGYGALLKQMANVALGGSMSRADNEPATLPVPLPVHARNWLKKLALGSNLDELAAALRPLLSKPATVTRLRRASIVGACLLLPVIGIFAAIFGTSVIRQWDHRYPGLFELTVLLQDRWARQLNSGFVFHFDASGFTKGRSPKIPDNPSGPSDRDLAIFISSHYRSLITNSTVWQSPLALSLIKGESRQFAEQSLVDHPAASPEEVERVAKVVEPRLPKSELPDIRKHPVLLAGVFHMLLAVYVGIPAVLAAILFRRSLVLLAAGVVFVRYDGRRASRGRLLLRSLFAWGLIVPSSIITLHYADSDQLWSGLLLLTALFCLTLISILLPKRGLPERFSGVYPVPA